MKGVRYKTSMTGGGHVDLIRRLTLTSTNPFTTIVTNNYSVVNPLTAGAAYNRVFIFYYHIKYHILNMFKIKCDINQKDLKRVDLHFVKSE